LSALWLNKMKTKQKSRGKMQKQRFMDDMDTLEVMEKRLEILTCARLRDKSQIKDAISVQDRLRDKSTGWSGTEEILKWRNLRK
jgi:hypothetical protein